MSIHDWQITHSRQRRINLAPLALCNLSVIASHVSVPPNQGTPMDKPQAQSEPQKAPYVKPKILTLKVDLSFASSATNFEDIIALAAPQPAAPTKEPPVKAKAAGVGGKPASAGSLP